MLFFCLNILNLKNKPIENKFKTIKEEARGESKEKKSDPLKLI